MDVTVLKDASLHVTQADTVLVTLLQMSTAIATKRTQSSQTVVS